jgi:hypothetical protein
MTRPGTFLQRIRSKLLGNRKEFQPDLPLPIISTPDGVSNLLELSGIVYTSILNPEELGGFSYSVLLGFQE